MSDGSHALLDIAEPAGIAFADVKKAAEALMESNLLKPIPD